MQGQLRSAFVTMVAGAPVRMGFDRPRPAVWKREGERLPKGTIERAWKGSREGAWHAYTHPVRLPTLDIHAVDKYLLAADMLGCERTAADFTMPAHPEAALRVAELFRAHGAEGKAPIVMAPGAQWETKRWRVEGFGAVARHFLLRGYPVLLSGFAARDRRVPPRRRAGARGGGRRRRDFALRARSADRPLGLCRDQRFRAASPCGCARAPGRGAVRTDESGVGGPVSAAQGRPDAVPPMLALLSPRHGALRA